MGEVRKVGTFQKEHWEREKKAKAKAKAENDTDDSDNDTKVPSDGTLSDPEFLSDDEDDGDAWWSGMHSKRPVTTAKLRAREEQGNSYDPIGLLNTDYKGGQQMKDAAAMMLMSILYPARFARFDLLKPVSFLAKCITRWDTKCDERLQRLMDYIKQTLGERMVGYIGDDPRVLTTHVYCDADFAGCPYTLKSTSGVHACVQGPNSMFAWSASSKGQTRVGRKP